MGRVRLGLSENQFRNWLGTGSVAGGAATGNQSGSAGTSAAAGTVDHTKRMMVVHIANDIRNPCFEGGSEARLKSVGTIA